MLYVWLSLGNHDGKISIGGRNITNLRFADDINAPAEEEQELEALVESLDKTCTRYKTEISAEKTKLMTNSVNGIQREIKVKGQKLATVTSFKYLGAVVPDDGSKPEVLSRIAQATTGWRPVVAAYQWWPFAFHTGNNVFVASQNRQLCKRKQKESP